MSNKVFLINSYYLDGRLETIHTENASKVAIATKLKNPDCIWLELDGLDSDNFGELALTVIEAQAVILMLQSAIKRIEEETESDPDDILF